MEVKPEVVKTRAFKSSSFAKKASKVGITDKELCEAIDEMNAEQWDADLGGNVYKKRLNQNRHRSILLSKRGSIWVFTYLFSKADRDNISLNELKSFKELATGIQTLTDAQLEALKAGNDLVEICNDCKEKIQK